MAYVAKTLDRYQAEVKSANSCLHARSSLRTLRSQTQSFSYKSHDGNP